MNTSVNNFDTLENVIFQNGLSIKAIHMHKDLDLMLVVLNTGIILRRPISAYKSLKNATNSQLMNFQIIAKGTGVHWKSLDEDLSLKGFLKEEVQLSILGGTKKGKLAA